MTKANSFKIVNEEILVSQCLPKKEDENQKVFTFCFPSGNIYKFYLPDKEMSGPVKLETAYLIYIEAYNSEDMSEKQQKELFSFLHENLKTT